MSGQSSSGNGPPHFPTAAGDRDTHGDDPDHDVDDDDDQDFMSEAGEEDRQQHHHRDHNNDNGNGYAMAQQPHQQAAADESTDGGGGGVAETGCSLREIPSPSSTSGQQQAAAAGSSGIGSRQQQQQQHGIASASASAASPAASAGIASSSSSHHDRYYNNNNNAAVASMSMPTGNDSNSSAAAATAAAATSATSTSEVDGLAVFTWGRGEDGQLGLGDTSDQDEPIYVDALRGVGVRQIACGSGHTVVLTIEGEVYTWGRGDDGRLGHGDNGWKYVPRIVQSLAGQIVIQVTCGSYHTAAVTGNGDLYTWGGGMYGKLGHGNEAGHSTPKRVEGLVGLAVSQIACGSRHTAIVTSTGALYTWGDKENGVAGHGETDGHQYTPRLVERMAGKRVVALSACGFHTGCLTDNDELYTWGEGKFGRLGHNTERNCHTPRLVETLLGKNPRQVSCGGFHTAVVTEDGRLYTFGGGEHGQLGSNARANALKPTLVQALEGVFVSQVTCGWSHSVALTAKGRVYTWGNGDHGKLGIGSGRKLSVPHLVEKLKDYRVVRVASYNEHTAALVEPSDHSMGLNYGGHYGAAYVTGGVPVTSAYIQHLRNMVNDDEFSDVTFMIEDTPVYAHRAILAQRCDHFAAMFRSGMRESVERMIPIPNISKQVFLLLLEYLYTDSVKIEVEHSVELYIAADLYHLERLRDMCCTVLRRNLSAENAGPLLQTASDNHCHALKEICMSYLVENFDIVSKTDGIKQVSHSLLLEVLSQR